MDWQEARKEIERQHSHDLQALQAREDALDRDRYS